MKTFKEYLEESVQFATLKHHDLTKNDGDRLDVFAEIVKTGKSFLTTQGNVILDKKEFEDAEEDFRRSGFRGTFSAIRVSDKSLIRVEYPRDFFKTPEFGGKGKGFGTAAEDRYLKKLQNKMQKYFEKNNIHSTDIIIGNRLVRNVVAVESTPGVPKSDFHFLDVSGNEVAWISHKAGSKPSDFQQYGGLTHPVFAKHTEITDFVNDVADKRPNGLNPKETFIRDIKDRQVLLKAIWGIDFKKARGRNNVDEFHQGEMRFVKRGKNLVLQSNHYLTNGKLPGSGYRGVYVMRYTKSSRNFGIAHARIGVFPVGSIAKTAIEI